MFGDGKHQPQCSTPRDALGLRFLAPPVLQRQLQLGQDEVGVSDFVSTWRRLHVGRASDICTNVKAADQALGRE